MSYPVVLGRYEHGKELSVDRAVILNVLNNYHYMSDSPRVPDTLGGTNL